MVLILECFIICFILLVPCVVAIANGVHNAAFLYERDVQDRVVKMGLITKERLERNRKAFKLSGRIRISGTAFKAPPKKKLAKHIQSWQDKGYAFTYKVFPNMGHGTLAGEHPEQFSQEVQAAHQRSREKEKR